MILSPAPATKVFAMKYRTAPFLLITLCASAVAAPQHLGPEGEALEKLAFPVGIDKPDWLAPRQAAQLATKPEFSVFVDFSFVDRQPESGITFKHRIVADAGETYKAVHYDHGNGVAVADVDGDGWYDLYFSNQVGGNELWRNKGDGTFENITETAGVAVAEPIGVSASFADIDNDGDPDLYVTTVRKGNRLFENDGKGKFRDITAASGLGHAGHSSGAVFFDFNRDGLLDLYLTNVGQYSTELVSRQTYEGVEYTYNVGYVDAFSGHRFPARTEHSLLFENQGGGTFENVTSTMYLVDSGWSGDAHIVDVNEDGWPDIFEVNMQGHDNYYENVQGESFIAKSRAVFPRTSWGAMGIAAFDWNNDGRMDIYVTDMHSDMSQVVGSDREKEKSDMQWHEDHLQSGGISIYGNSFFEKQADGSYREISDQIGAENYWPWGPSTGDLNADGYQDVFIASSMNYPFRYGVNSVLINERGQRFRDAEFILGVEPRRDGAIVTPWFHRDCTGIDEATRQNLQAMLKRRECIENEGNFMVYGALGSRSSVIFDLDNDGDLDIVTNDFNSHPMVLVSDLAQKNDELSWLKIRLVGTQSNRSGLGARVTVQAGDNKYVQVMDGKSGYLSQSLQPLYFGLDGAGNVDGVVVQWPSGRVQTLTGDLPVNELLEITEPSD